MDPKTRLRVMKKVVWKKIYSRSNMGLLYKDFEKFRALVVLGRGTEAPLSRPSDLKF